jgi:hypothetical protein
MKTAYYERQNRPILSSMIKSHGNQRQTSAKQLFFADLKHPTPPRMMLGPSDEREIELFATRNWTKDADDQSVN